MYFYFTSNDKNTSTVLFQSYSKYIKEKINLLNNELKLGTAISSKSDIYNFKEGLRNTSATTRLPDDLIIHTAKNYMAPNRKADVGMGRKKKSRSRKSRKTRKSKKVSK